MARTSNKPRVENRTQLDGCELYPLMQLIVQYYTDHPEEKAKVDAEIAKKERKIEPCGNPANSY